MAHRGLREGIGPAGGPLPWADGRDHAPIAKTEVDLVRELSARYPHAHGAPVHIGDMQEIGITDVGRPDYGEPVPIYPNEIPVFWACGATPQAVAEGARVEFMSPTSPHRAGR